MQGQEVVGQGLPHEQQFLGWKETGKSATLGTQGGEKSLTPKMTPVVGRSWGVTIREDEGRGLLGGMRR